MNQLISINLITHNRAKYLPQAIQSVLDQEYSNWELIIIDDASSDETKEVIGAFLFDERIKYFLVAKQKNIAAVRNIALSKSQGGYLAVLDSDDKWVDSGKLAKQVSFLNNNQSVVLIGTSAQIINENNEEIDKIIKPITDEGIKKEFFIKNPFFHSSILVRKEQVDNIGGYSESLSFGEDLDLYMRLGEKGLFANLEDICVAYRSHSDNEAKKNTLKAITDVFRIIANNRKRYKKNIFIYFNKAWQKMREIL
jgi:glycosyltransferase involved in cell wall biosynthesis